MNITIEVTKEQEEIIERYVSLAKFEQELKSYADGLVNFYVSEGQKVIMQEEEALDKERLNALKANTKTLELIDAAIKVTKEPIKEEVL